MSGATLIFPATSPEALREAGLLRLHGVTVILAASVPPDRLNGPVPNWELLPYVSDPHFPDALRRLAERHGIVRISAPVQSVHRFLEELLAKGDWPFQLVNPAPIRAAVTDHASFVAKATAARALVDAVAVPRSGPPTERLAALLRASGSIYGESAAEKLLALAGIFATAPRGDIVEIGSLVGRSTAALALLAAWYRIGTVVAVDPWNMGDSRRRDAPGFVTRMSDSWRCADMEAMFRINMMAVTTTPFVPLAMPSTAACPLYSAGAVLDGPLGPAPLEGRIAVLHIDGNHDEEAVAGDCRDWVPLIKASGWLVLDDYLWAHGAGPRRAGDALLARNAGRIARAFVVAGALFVKFADRPVV